MASPSKPVNISSPRRAPDEIASSTPGTPGRFNIGTPSSRPFARQMVGTPPTPPIANIPPRTGGAGMSYGSPSGLAFGLSRTPQTGLRSGTGGTNTPTVGVIPSPSGSPGRNLDDVTDEEMARVLRRHLVPRSERLAQAQSGAQTPVVDAEEEGVFVIDAGTGSRRPSMHSSGAASSSRQQLPVREDSEPFPIPYDAPGGDIT